MNRTFNRRLAAIAAASLLGLQCVQGPAWAENKMGYRLLSPQAAAGLPHNHGALGMDVERAQQITDDGLTFDIIRVKHVRPGSPGARAGFNVGDQIIAIDGMVFPTIATFAACIGAAAPGTQVNVDYIPAGGGPAEAQRIAVTVGTAGGGVAANAAPPAAASTGMSTETKVAIGVGAAALLGRYLMSRRGRSDQPAPQ